MDRKEEGSRSRDGISAQSQLDVHKPQGGQAGGGRARPANVEFLPSVQTSL